MATALAPARTPCERRAGREPPRLRRVGRAAQRALGLRGRTRGRRRTQRARDERAATERRGQGQEAGAGRARGGDEAERASTERAETLGSVVLDGETGHSVDRPERDQAYDATSEAEDAAAASALSAHVPGARQCCRGDERRCGEERCCVAMPRRGGHAGQDAGGGQRGSRAVRDQLPQPARRGGPRQEPRGGGRGRAGRERGGRAGQRWGVGGRFPRRRVKMLGLGRRPETKTGTLARVSVRGGRVVARGGTRGRRASLGTAGPGARG